MTLFDYFKSIDFNEIERFVSDRKEENLSIEFKTVNHPNYNDQNKEFDKKNFSEGLSGFANSNGGIIIWGVKAKKNSLGQDVATSLAPISELTKFLNFLNRNEGQVVMPIIEGIRHERINSEEDTGFVKSFIPFSQLAPHMALFAGKHYYKRSGDSFYQCEHYDIVDMFSRNKSPNLKLSTRILKKSTLNQEKTRYEVIISICNDAKTIAKYPYLAINCNHHYRPSEYGLDGNKNCGLEKIANNISYKFNYAGGNKTVIYPESSLDVDKFSTEVYKTEIPEDLKIEYMLCAENMETLKGEIIVDRRKIMTESVQFD